MKLPQDLVEYLDNPPNREVSFSEGEIRNAVFFSSSELKLSKFRVDSYDFFLNGILENDPGEQRYYEAYSLIRECNSYSPNGVLAWFPSLEAYGSADIDHSKIITYPVLEWSEIESDLQIYINGMWYPHLVPHDEVNPWLDS